MRKARSGSVQPDGHRIKTLLGEKGWYRDELVKRTRLKSRTIDKVLAGERVEIATLEAVARALDEPYHLLVMRNEPITRNAVAVVESKEGFLTVKAAINFEASFPKDGPPPKKVITLVQLIKELLPDNEDVRLLAIGPGVISIVCRATERNTEALRLPHSREALKRAGVEAYSVARELTEAWASLKDVLKSPPGPPKEGRSEERAALSGFPVGDRVRAVTEQKPDLTKALKAWWADLEKWLKNKASNDELGRR
jgi:hypothetical protein